jgi:hypothetical protein
MKITHTLAACIIPSLALIAMGVGPSVAQDYTKAVESGYCIGVLDHQALEWNRVVEKEKGKDQTVLKRMDDQIWSAYPRLRVSYLAFVLGYANEHDDFNFLIPTLVDQGKSDAAYCRDKSRTCYRPPEFEMLPSPILQERYQQLAQRLMKDKSDQEAQKEVNEILRQQGEWMHRFESQNKQIEKDLAQELECRKQVGETKLCKRVIACLK